MEVQIFTHPNAGLSKTFSETETRIASPSPKFEGKIKSTLNMIICTLSYMLIQRDDSDSIRVSTLQNIQNLSTRVSTLQTFQIIEGRVHNMDIRLTLPVVYYGQG